MKMKLLSTIILTAALVAVPSSLLAQDKDKNVDVDVNVKDKISEANRETHQKICQGHHGSVTAKDANSVTIDGKRHALTADTRVTKQEEAVLLKGVKVGDHVCYTTQKAADGSMQVSQIIAVPKDTEKVRVREQQNDAPSKIEVETPDKKIEVK